MFDSNVGRRIRGDVLGIKRVMALAWKNRRETLSPGFFHGRQNAQFVVHYDVPPGWISICDGVEHLFFVDVDQYAALYRLPEPRTLYFAGLEGSMHYGYRGLKI